MGRVVVDVSMSLGGFTAGPNVREAEPMGGRRRTPPRMDGRERDRQRHRCRRAPRSGRERWRRGHRKANVRSRCRPVGRHAVARCAQLRGHPSGEAGPARQQRRDLCLRRLQAAVRRAKQAAGDKDVLVLGADVSRQLLSAGLLDELPRPPRSAPVGRGNTTVRWEQAELIAEGSP
jgi:hypothetical protein